MIKNLPKHIALIPDGNRRWARKRGLAPWEGHREGMKRFQEVIEEAFSLGIPYCTFWGGSEDNLTKRTRQEIKFLTVLIKQALKRLLKSEDAKKRETHVRVIGRWREILGDAQLTDLVGDLERRTSPFHKKHLTILFGYDGRREMIEAIKKLRANPSKHLDYDTVTDALWTGYLPPVDLVIRTGGEPHWSAGFMMWHTANSQLYFTEKFWPDFTKVQLKKALQEYGSRERRMGK